MVDTPQNERKSNQHHKHGDEENHPDLGQVSVEVSLKFHPCEVPCEFRFLGFLFSTHFDLFDYLRSERLRLKILINQKENSRDSANRPKCGSYDIQYITESVSTHCS